MGTNKIIGIALILCGILLFVNAISIAYEGFTTTDEVEYVDCFDRYGNRIIGEQCIDETPYDFIGAVMLLAMLGVFMVGIGSNLWKFDFY